MESIARPLRRLQEEAAWFARAHEVKLLHVRTDATLRGAVLDLAMAQENHAANRSLFFRFDDPVSGPDRGWGVRVQRLRALWDEKAASVEPAGIHVRALPPPSAGANRQAGGEFAATLLAAKSCLGPPLTGVVVVLAPSRVEEGAELAGALGSLVESPLLAHVRWIVVEADGAHVASVATRLSARALVCECLVDEKEQQDDLTALGVASAKDPPPVPRPLGWRSGGAMPDVAPPPRVDLPPPPSDEALRAEGLSPAFVNGGADALKQLILGAALALRQKRPVDAVTLQGRAAALCAEMGMPREQVLNLVVLGGYVLAAGQRGKAREVYEGAARIARAHGASDLESQTELALGLLDAVDRRPADAAAHYASAGRLAEQAKSEALAIECWRMAGQLALDAKLESSAVDCWKRAISLAEPLEPDVAKVTSAHEAATALATLCRKRGLHAQAQSLEEQAFALQTGEAPVSAAPTGTG